MFKVVRNSRWKTRAERIVNGLELGENKNWSVSQKYKREIRSVNETFYETKIETMTAFSRKSNFATVVKFFNMVGYNTFKSSKEKTKSKN